MADADIFFGEDDDAPFVTDTLLGADGEPIDLTGATVVMRFRARAPVDDDATFTESVALDGDPTEGGIEWQPASGRAPGDYNGNWVVTLQGGNQITVPNDRYLWIKVLPKP